MAKPRTEPTSQVRAIFGAGVIVGLCLGGLIVASLWHPNVPIWYFWAPLALVLATTAGTAPAIGLAAIDRLEHLRPLRRRWPIRTTMGVVLVTLIVVNLPWLFPDSDSIAQNALLISWTVIAGSPMALALLGIRQVILEAKNERRGDQIELLLELRRLARSLVMGGGALTALVTLQGGVVMSLQREIDASYSRPQQFVLVIGAIGTLLVGGLYVVTRAALQSRSLDLASDLSPIEGLDAADAIEKALERRRILLGALEADRSVLSDLQADLIVLAPLIASAAAVILPRSS